MGCREGRMETRLEGGARVHRIQLNLFHAGMAWGYSWLVAQQEPFINGRVAICHFPLSRCSAFHLSCSNYPFLRLPICTPLLTLVTLHRHLLSDINIFNSMYFIPVPSACIPTSDLGSSLQVATQPKTGPDSGRFTLQ